MATKYKPSSVVEIEGVSKSLNAWAMGLNCPVQTILGRLTRGWTLADAVSKPLSALGGQSRGKTYDSDVLVGDEVGKLLDSGRKSETAVRDRSYIVVGYRSGLRCSELLSLKTKDIDLVAGTVRVQHGKGDKSRTVAIDPMAVSHLEEWFAIRQTWPITSDSPVFCTRKGKRLCDRQMRAMMSRRGKNAGINKRVHTHGLRHTMASEMAAEGVPLLDISGALGHTNVATTNTYLQKINPMSVLEAMRSRTWGNQQPTAPRPASQAPTVPPPDWLTRLLSDIGERLMLIHDGRSSETDFKAAVLLF